MAPKRKQERAEGPRPSWEAALGLVAEVQKQLTTAKEAAVEALAEEARLKSQAEAVEAMVAQLEPGLKALRELESQLDAFGLAEHILVVEEAIALATTEAEEQVVELLVQAEQATASLTPAARKLAQAEAQAIARAKADRDAKEAEQATAAEAKLVARAKAWLNQEAPKAFAAARHIEEGAEVRTPMWQRIQKAMDASSKGRAKAVAELMASLAVDRFGLAEERQKDLEDFVMAERKKSLPGRKGQRPRDEGEDKPAPPMSVADFGGEPEPKKQDGPLVSVLLDKLPASEREKAGRIVTDLLKVARQVGRPINGEAYVTKAGRIRLRLLDSGQTYPLDGKLAEKLLA